MKKTILFIFLFIFVGGFIGMGLAHEQLHKIIWNHYDVDSKIKLEFPSLVTYTNDVSNCNDTCLLAQEINDIVAYHLQFFYILIGMGLFILIIKEKS